MIKKLITPKVEDIIQSAIYQELTASHTYRHLSNQMQRSGYFGAAKYFAGEAASELEHYQKHADFLNDRGSVATLPELDAIGDTITDLGEALETAYEMEVDLGKRYEAWYRAALQDDVTTAQYLLQFLEIQRDSVGEYGDLLARLDKTKDNPAALLMIDNELGA